MSQDSDEHLIRYLLGELPEAEAERLDERSITDDAFAERLRLLEDDIVDRYTRGESLGIARSRIEEIHRASPYLQQKVRFAKALHAWTTKAQVARRDPSPDLLSRWRRWTLAAAAILLVAAAGYMARTHQHLRSEFAQLEQRHSAVERQNAQLHRQPETVPVQGATPSPTITATFLLPPPRRGAEAEPAIAVSKDSTRVAFRLEVESDAYPRFWAALKDISSSAIVWRSRDVDAEPAGANRIATIVVPAEILRPQRYVIELTGIRKSGATELLGSYPVRVIIE